MTETKQERLREQLKLDPGDWETRLALIDSLFVQGKASEAKALVRDSPDEVPFSKEQQKRLREILKKGAKIEQGQQKTAPEPAPSHTEFSGGYAALLDETNIDPEKLRKQLQHHPEDWNLRIALIEHLVNQGEVAAAKRLVRESPDDVSPPVDIQRRLRHMLRQRPEKERNSEHVPSSDQSSPIHSSAYRAVMEEISLPNTTRRSRPPAPQENPDVPSRSEASEFAGGFAALVEESATKLARPSSSKPSSPDSTTVPPPTLHRASSSQKWDQYHGDLNLEEVDLDQEREEASQRRDRISSLSLSVLLHIVFFILLSLAVVQVQKPEPPQLIASALPQRDADIVPTRISEARPELQLSAAASSDSISAITTVALPSTFALPETQTSTDMIAALMPSVGAASMGRDLMGAAPSSSDVTFFGLSGRGDKIVFIVDATPDMLVDEKGGMSAYDKVKDEIGIMLANLNRGTRFNIILYQDKNVVAFRPELVQGLPSNLREAIEWLDPLNRDYKQLGVSKEYGQSLTLSENDRLPILPSDLAHYSKAIAKALEWEANTIFCIVSGYRPLRRTPDEKTLEKIKKARESQSELSAAEQKALEDWKKAVAKTQAWLARENAARREKGLDQKVVTNFPALVREVTGFTPPRIDPSRINPVTIPPITREDIEHEIDLLVRKEMKEKGIEKPSLHMVLFLGEQEQMSEEDESHFKNLTRKNRGKLKILRGLAALQNVTQPSGQN